MIRYLIKTDYILSVWMAHTKDRIMPLVEHLILTKASFVTVGLLLMFDNKLNLDIDPLVFTLFVMIITAIIMTMPRKAVRRIVAKEGFIKKYKKYSRKEKLWGRFFGLTYLISSFALMFLLPVFFS